MIALLFVAACKDGADGSSADSGPPASKAVPWSREVPVVGDGPRGWSERRAIVHLHSPWSHDACDGDPLPYGEPNAPCLADLREGLCTDRIDFAFLTDHPSEAAWQPYEDLFLQQPGDELVVGAGGAPVASRVSCENGHSVLWMPGIEDELMPVSLDRHAAGDDFAENDRLYNSNSDESIASELAAGAAVIVPHTEQRDPADLARLQAQGLTGIEVFNLHAMFDPDIRAEHLGLDPLGWAEGIAPFTSPDATGEPDLMFLGVLEEQVPTVAKWDALLASGRATGVGGSDAHQNVLILPLRDGERGDSYRRTLRWFANRLWVDGDDPDAAQAALAAGRVYVAMEVLGVPVGFDFGVRDAGGTLHEMGGDAPEGTLVVGCPGLDPASPRGETDPEFQIHVLKDGQPFAEGCGEHPTDGPGAYRVRVDVVPRHLEPFLGEDPEPWMRPFPWIYGNAVRVAL